MIRSITRLAALAVLAFIASSSPAAAQGAGIKFGPTFATFSSDALDFDNRTGIHAGLFVGGSRNRVVGLQTEFNWLRQNTETEAGTQIRIDYLQIPLLLRLNAGSSSANGFAVYGIVGRDDDAQRLADRARDFLGPEGVVYSGPFRSEGARLWTREAGA